ncbi:MULTISPECIES: hypothetical protein [Microbispora]|nr:MULTISPECIES: hypothetical protein [Microbispora]
MDAEDTPRRLRSMLAGGLSAEIITECLGLHRSRVYQIRDNNR